MSNNSIVFSMFDCLYCLALFVTVEFDRLPCPNNEMHDDAVFADRFRYQLTMFGIHVLIGYLNFFMLILHMKQIPTKSSQNFLLFA